MRLTSIIGATLPFLFAGVITSVYIDNFLLEQTLDRVLDLNFVRTRTDAEDILILLLAHLVLSASRSSALSVMRIFSNASSCSVFTSAAVASFTGLTLRADLNVV